MIDSYNVAKASVNAFLEDEKTRSVQEVDVPKDVFEKSKANRDLEKFIGDAKAARKTIGPLEVLGIAEKIIDLIVRLNRQRNEVAYQRFVKIIDDNKMVAFDQVPTKVGGSTNRRQGSMPARPFRWRARGGLTRRHTLSVFSL